MSTLVDHQIRHLARTRGLVEPYEPELQNPASYDVTLGSKVLVEVSNGGWQEVDISVTTLYMQPGAFVLACTEELIRIPDDLEAIFCLKSSRGREGYNHMLAGYIDPGFHGRVTLELHNCTRFRQLPLYAGMRIGQLRFSRLDEIPHRPYSLTGRYNNDDTTTPSKG